MRNISGPRKPQGLTVQPSERAQISNLQIGDLQGEECQGVFALSPGQTRLCRAGKRCQHPSASLLPGLGHAAPAGSSTQP